MKNVFSFQFLVSRFNPLRLRASARVPQNFRTLELSNFRTLSRSVGNVDPTC